MNQQISRVCTRFWDDRLHFCAYTYAQTHMCTYYMYTYTNICTHVRTYTHTYLCIEREGERGMAISFQTRDSLEEGLPPLASPASLFLGRQGSAGTCVEQEGGWPCAWIGSQVGSGLLRLGRGHRRCKPHLLSSLRARPRPSRARTRLVLAWADTPEQLLVRVTLC